MDTLGKIGLLNGGGDRPGLNAVTRAVVRTVHYPYHGKVVAAYPSKWGFHSDRIER